MSLFINKLRRLVYILIQNMTARVQCYNARPTGLIRKTEVIFLLWCICKHSTKDDTHPSLCQVHNTYIHPEVAMMVLCHFLL